MRRTTSPNQEEPLHAHDHDHAPIWAPLLAPAPAAAGAIEPLDPRAVLAGTETPLYSDSALTSFGVSSRPGHAS
jgi:peptide subunit release factor RF-3